MDDIEGAEGLVFLLLIAAALYIVYKGVQAVPKLPGVSALSPTGSNFSASNPAGGSASIGLSDRVWKLFHPNDPYSAAPGAPLPGNPTSGSAAEADFGIVGNNSSPTSSWDMYLTP